MAYFSSFYRSYVTPDTTVVFLSVLISLCAVLITVSAQQRQLRFQQNGEFKILQVADMHYANGESTGCRDVLEEQDPWCSDVNTTSFVDWLIGFEKPNLIVFTGDNIYKDARDAAESMNAAFAPAIASGIPWAAILGNHDQESTLSRERLMNHIVGLNYTLSKVNPPEAHGIDGFGNYNLEVGGVEGSELQNKSLLNLYFLDSGDYSTDKNIDGYGWIKPSQQTWFQDTSNKLKEEFREGPVALIGAATGLVFFHIPLPEVNDIDKETIIGVKQEDVACADENSGFFEAIVKSPDVIAAFTGHDHKNDFCGKLRGVQLCYAGGIGYHAYGKAGWARRARVIVASLQKMENGGWGLVETIKTWKRLDDEQFTQIDDMVLWTANEL